MESTPLGHSQWSLNIKVMDNKSIKYKSNWFHHQSLSWQYKSLK